MESFDPTKNFKPMTFFDVTNSGFFRAKEWLSSNGLSHKEMINFPSQHAKYTDPWKAEYVMRTLNFANRMKEFAIASSTVEPLCDLIGDNAEDAYYYLVDKLTMSKIILAKYKGYSFPKLKVLFESPDKMANDIYIEVKYCTCDPMFSIMVKHIDCKCIDGYYDKLTKSFTVRLSSYGGNLTPGKFIADTITRFAQYD